MVKKLEVDFTKLDLKPVTTSIVIGSTLNRDPAGGILYRSGRFPNNIEATEMWHALVLETGITPGSEAAYYEVDAANKVVSVRPVVGIGDNVMPVRYLTGSETISLHLGGVFKEYPKLRPKGKSTVAVMPGKDSSGEDCMLILLATALGKATQTGKPRQPRKQKDDKGEQGNGQPQPQPDTTEPDEEEVAASEDKE